MTDEIRVRFAPSPTGHFHIGTARTALFNWLFARNMGGVFVLRIEDTDSERSTREFEKSIIEDLAWLGLAWDEGPDIGGPVGPYRQSERMEAGVYKKLATDLLTTGHAYECFCTTEELGGERKKTLAEGGVSQYSGRCRNLSSDDRAQFIAEGRKPSIRFAVPESRRFAFKDVIRGRLDFEAEAFGDFIIVRQNGVPTYNFAVVVDDSQMGITHVLRGEDHLSNTAKQLMIFEALNFEPPIFGHLSMIFGPDKAKLSKRHGAASIIDYRRQGFIPEATINYLSLLGWTPASGQEILDVASLAAEFDLSRISKSPAIFDIDRLKWFNGQYIRKLDRVTLTNLVVPYLVESGFVKPEDIADEFNRLTRIVEASQTSLEVLADIKECAKIFGEIKFSADVAERLAEDRAQKVIKVFISFMTEAETVNKDEAKDLIRAAADKLKEDGFKGKEIFQTTRLALTGTLSGPELFYIIFGLGPKETKRKLENCVS